MRIVHVSDSYLPVLGGKELHVHDLAHAQAALGHDVVVVTRTPDAAPGTGPAPAPSGAASGSVRVVRVPDGDRHGVVRELLHRTDVVHAHLSVVSPFAWTGLRQAAAAGVPVLAMVHVILPAAAPVRAGWRAAAAAAGPGVLWGTVSAAAARVLADVVPGPVRVLPNGIDQAAWAPDGPGLPAPSGGPVTVVVSGRLAPRKRVLPMVAVLDEARRLAGPGVPLRAVVVGDGPLRPLVSWQVRTRGMSEWVELAGRLDRTGLRQVYRQADLFLAPARVESFGLAALEARCAGLPVVALAGTGIADFVTDGVEGRLADDDAGLAAAVAELVTDPVQRGRIAAHNRAVQPGFGWPTVLGRCLDLYAAAGHVAAAQTRQVAGRPVLAGG